MPSPSSDWQVYEEQLGNLGYGKPLWQPEYPEGGARIGDVGFVRGGRFQALWNVVDPRPSDPMSPPEGFVKLKYNKALLEQTNPEFLAPIPYVSNNVTYKKIDTNAGAVVGPGGAGAGFSFQCSKSQGAVLLLREHGSLHEVLPSNKFIDYIRANHKQWVEHIQSEVSEQAVQAEDIILISGTIKTRTWAMASFMDRNIDYDVGFQGSFGPVAQAGASVAYSQQSYTSTITRNGPLSRLTDVAQNQDQSQIQRQSHSGPEVKDQTVFIHYYKVRYRPFWLPAKIVAHGPEEQWDDDQSPAHDPSAMDIKPEAEAEPEVEVEVEHEPSLKQPERSIDPLDPALDYIFKNSDAEVACVTSQNIIELCGGHWPEDLKAYLEAFMPHVEVVDGCGSLSINDMIVRRNALEFQTNEVEVIPPPQAPPAPPEPTEDENEGSQAEDGAEDTEGAGGAGGTENAENGEGAVGAKGTAAVEGEFAREEESTVVAAEGPISNDGSGENNEDDQSEAGPSESRSGDAMIPPTTTTKEVPESLRGGTLVLERLPRKGTITDWPHRVFLEDAAAGGAVCAMDVSSDGQNVVAGYEDGNVRVWNLDRIAMTHKLNKHRETVWGVGFSADGSKVVSGCADHHGMIWDLHAASTEEGYEPVKLIGHDYDIWCVALSPDGTRAASGSVDNSVRLWDPKTGNQLAIMKAHTAVVINVVFSPDSTQLLSTADSTGHLWEASTGESIATLTGHDGVIWSAHYSNNGARIVTGSEDHTSRVWDAENGDELVIIREHTGPVWSVAFSPDDQSVASGSYDASVSVCDSFTGSQILSLGEKLSIVTEVVYSPDGEYLAAGCADGSIKLWELETGDLLAEIKAHEDKVKDIMFTPSSKKMISGSDDGTIRVWEMVHIMRVV